MSNTNCGCSESTCKCCEGVSVLTPESEYNRPGLPALTYRAGTHGSFLETMKARLAGLTLKAVGSDGQTQTTFRPLQGLTTRDESDPAIALLDSWATIADVLTFYQERFANEGYLRTAVKRRSVLELSRLVGYTLRPGVASSVYVAYTLDDNQTDPVTIPAGSRSQSIPGPGEMPQYFETNDDLLTRKEWNDLEVRATRPQVINLSNALEINTLYVSGLTTNLRTGDLLLLSFGTDDFRNVARRVKSVDTQMPNNVTVVNLQPLSPDVLATVHLLAQVIEAVKTLVPATPGSTNAPANATPTANVAAPAAAGAAQAGNAPAAQPRSLAATAAQAPAAQDVAAPSAAAQSAAAQNDVAQNGQVTEEFVAEGGPTEVIEKAELLLNDVFLDIPSDPNTWFTLLTAAGGYYGSSSALQAILQNFNTAVTAALANLPGASVPTYTTPAVFVPTLLKPVNLQPASTAQLSRTIQVQMQANSDVHPQLLLTFAPTLENTLYQAWENANIKSISPALQGLYAVRVSAPLFGSSAPAYIYDPTATSPWSAPQIDNSEAPTTLFLDRPYPTILADSMVVIQQPYGSGIRRDVRKVVSAQTTPRTAYGASGNSTRIDVDRQWWNADEMGTLRGTYVYGQTDELTLAEEPLPDTVSGSEIELANLYRELTSGRWVIVSGERADIPGVSGVISSELIMMSGLVHGTDADIPNDKVHTTLLLATPTAYTYKRSTLTIYGNVAKATNGQTRMEVLGSGDATQTFASHVLKQPPLTYVSDPNPTGVKSTLAVYVNNVKWTEVATMAGAGPADRVFTTTTDDNANTTVIFGDGEHGAVPPTGVQNLNAVYRSDLGPAGNVRASQISMLVSQPLGVKGVTNPLAASGGAGPESRDRARSNAPLAVMSLDRLVSVEDYANFTRTYAGIGKAASRKISNGQRQLVHVTIAGAEDIPIDTTSDLYRNLLLALHNYGDVALPVQVDLRELKILVLSVSVKILPAYKWEIVSAAIRTAVLAEFGFDARDLGQPALLCDLIAAIQNIEGVDYVDVIAFGGIPEKEPDGNGGRKLLTLDELATAAQDIANSRIPKQVAANFADFEKGGIRPAQLAAFTPNVPDTLILNQVL
ncbi:putative baseplate assembly protein [Granulicella arctica]|uniref:putative baseplate assembly protein n=1 Tax=Granulicella arctica TaxID=940613 RepID=UPI0021E0EAF9|nr:putative baseplate assembly protein [Granulicella arctica]